MIRASDGRILEATGDLAALYGYRREELLAKTVFELRPEATRRQVAPQMAIAEVRPIRFDTGHLRRDGRMVRVEVESHGAMRDGVAVLLSTIRPARAVPRPDPAPEAAAALAGSSGPWSEDLEIGIEELDVQHRDICDAVGHLRGAMKHREPLHVREVLAALQEYVGHHFSLEEEYMARLGAPGLPAHRAAHQAFAREFAAQKARLEADTSASAILALSSWLSDWIRGHLRSVDREMGRFLRAALARERAGGQPPPRPTAAR